MSAPHVAGAAAVLLQLNPSWSPEQVKSALVNTAKRPVGSSGANTPLANPQFRGGGRVDLAAAIAASATIEAKEAQASISYGRIPASSFSRTVDVTVTSVSATSYVYTVSVAAAISCGGCVSTSVTLLPVASGSSSIFSVTVTVVPSMAKADYFGDIKLTGGPVDLLVPYWFSLGSPLGGGGSAFKV